MDLQQQIEGILFYKAEPVEKAFLADRLSVSAEELEEALASLQDRLESGGTRLSMTDTEVQLVSAPELSELIESLRKDELKKGIGRAGAETLAIVLYRGPLTRAEIDRIRGVNSTFILRNLLVRGLVERRQNPKNKLSYFYAATPELLNHLGISKREELPQFEEIMNSLDTFESEQKEREAEEARGAFHSDDNT